MNFAQCRTAALRHETPVANKELLIEAIGIAGWNVTVHTARCFHDPDYPDASMMNVIWNTPAVSL
jgi:hypothetical protein